MALWSKTKTQSKVGFDKVYSWVDKAGAPVNRLSNKVGSEAFWPTTLDIESDKAARILKSFCSKLHDSPSVRSADLAAEDGFYEEEDRPISTDVPKGKQRVLKKIPSKVIQNAKGLCIFTTMRSGLWVSGSGGAGIIVARKPDGTWSPPSGIMMHTVGVGFLVGVDIYDCVIVINSDKAMEAFQSIRCTLGGEISAVAGPAGVGGILDTEVHKRQSPLFTYIKSRGFYAGLQLDGTIIIERTDENERFYGERIGVKDILAGNVRHPPYETRRLLETLRSAQGDTDVDESLIPDGASPADFEIVDPDTIGPDEKIFGIPDAIDPDPYGVLALQEAGLEIREAGTNSRPTSEQFEFKPSASSPIYNTFRNSSIRNSTYRRSMDRSSYAGSRPTSRPTSWRNSTVSSLLEPRTPTVDMSTQTDDLPPPPTVKKSPPTLPPRTSVARPDTPPTVEIPETRIEAATPTREKNTESRAQETTPTIDTRVDSSVDKKSTALAKAEVDDDDDDDEDDDDDDDEDDFEEEAVVHEVHQAAAPQVITRARVIQVAKPVAPQLPMRSPFRNRFSTNSDGSLSTVQDGSSGASPIVPKHSPDSTPSLMRGDSTSSLSSVEDSRLEHIGSKLRPKYSNDRHAPKEENDGAFHSLPESPIKNIPGGFN
jgi:lipid-binding SYLF domain-containing protein/archaellum component FlaD/FlaE